MGKYMKINKIVKFLKNPCILFCFLTRLGLLRHLSDEKCLKLLYIGTYGRKLNLNNPKLFSEKLQWLKLYDRDSSYSKMVDKYEAKKYVAQIIGDEYIIPTLGVWDTTEEIEFDILPEQYILKCTHDCGSFIKCKKKDVNVTSIQRKLEKHMKRNYYWLFREWPYKDVKPRIIAEKYMSAGNDGLVDYKFYCFNGHPRFLYVSRGLENHSTAQISFLNLDWTFAPFKRIDYKEFDELPEKPSCFDEMINICYKLSYGLRFVRVDLYQIDNQVYFSELTFSPCSGFMIFESEKSDKEIGDMLIL